MSKRRILTPCRIILLWYILALVYIKVFWFNDLLKHDYYYREYGQTHVLYIIVTFLWIMSPILIPLSIIYKLIFWI